MSVFICWSGDRSHALAIAVRRLLLRTLGLKGNRVFVSDRIEKGVTWFDSIVKQLEKSNAGIVCLTAENAGNPWLHFEAGALALGLRKTASPSRRRLFTLLHRFTGAELAGPLSAYQATGTTKADIAAMARSVAAVVGKTPLRAKGQDGSIFKDKDWSKFEAELSSLAVPATKLVTGLEKLFEGRPFTEPLKQIAREEWFRCYDEVRLTRVQLETHLPRVRAACASHELVVFQMLMEEVEQYGVSIEELLRSPETASGPGDCCESRRLAIRSLLGLLLYPPGKPLREKAVRFMAAETDEERKMIVIGLENSIRHERDRVFEGGDTRQLFAEAIANLTGGLEPVQFRESSWDLDRIYYYLLVRYFLIAPLRWKHGKKSSKPFIDRWENDEPTPLTHDWRCAGRDVSMEGERYRVGAKGVSLLPLHYALVALQRINGAKAPKPEVAREAVRKAVEFVEMELGAELAGSAVGQAIQRVVNEMRPNGPSGAPATLQSEVLPRGAGRPVRATMPARQAPRSHRR